MDTSVTVKTTRTTATATVLRATRRGEAEAAEETITIQTTTRPRSGTTITVQVITVAMEEAMGHTEVGAEVGSGALQAAIRIRSGSAAATQCTNLLLLGRTAMLSGAVVRTKSGHSKSFLSTQSKCLTTSQICSRVTSGSKIWIISCAYGSLSSSRTLSSQKLVK